MILKLLLNVILGIFEFLMSPLPAMPSDSSPFTNVIDGLGSVIQSGQGLLRYIYGDALFVALAAGILALFLFEFVFHLLFWVLAKLPIIGR